MRLWHLCLLNQVVYTICIKHFITTCDRCFEGSEKWFYPLVFLRVVYSEKTLIVCKNCLLTNLSITRDLLKSETKALKNNALVQTYSFLGLLGVHCNSFDQNCKNKKNTKKKKPAKKA